MWMQELAYREAYKYVLLDGAISISTNNYKPTMSYHNLFTLVLHNLYTDSGNKVFTRELSNHEMEDGFYGCANVFRSEVAILKAMSYPSIDTCNLMDPEYKAFGKKISEKWGSIAQDREWYLYCLKKIIEGYLPGRMAHLYNLILD